MPITPEELAAAAAGAVAAGAEAVHVHPRGADGSESLAGEDIGAAVRAIRARCSSTLIGVSTGLWITAGDPGVRLAAVRAWADLSSVDRPDFASVNLSETGFGAVAEALLAVGIGVEAGVWSVGDADALAASGIAGRCDRVLVEIIDAPARGATEAASAVLSRLDGLNVPGQWLVHGEGEATWPLVAMAARLGLATRIGLEDTVVSPGGHLVRDNAELVRLALEHWPS